MDPTRTGEWIAARRKEKNLTQRELAARLGITDKAVSRWETGKGYPDVSLLPVLADELGCTVQVYIEGELFEFTKNFVVYVPAGTKHCPLNFLNVTRPVINYSGGPNVEYRRKYADGTYRVN